MALVHDVAESLVGDITPHCGVSEGEKHRLEADAVGSIQDMLGRGTQAGGCCAAARVGCVGWPPATFVNRFNPSLSNPSPCNPPPSNPPTS